MVKEYTPEILKKLQQYELEILKDFIKVCEENDLSYFAFAGTAIGAVRHGGFIPWDDDIDVAIPRADYDKLIEIFKHNYADKYYILNAEECNKYPLMTTRICLKDSMFVERFFKHLDAPLGIFLDVYPLDTPASDEKEHKRQQRAAFILGKLLILKHCPFPLIPFKGIKGKLVHAATWCVWAFLNLFGISHKRIYNKAISYTRKHNGEESEYYEHFFSQKYAAGVNLKSDIFPLKKLPFEDIKVCFMNNYEKELRDSFGDYMQLPPPEKRKNHFPYVLKFPGEEPISGDYTSDK